MNAQANAGPVPSLEAQVIAPVAISPVRRFYWSLRREIWEYRSIYIAPVAVAGVALVSFIIASLGRALTTQDPAVRRAALEEPPTFAALALMGVTLLVAVFYCLDAFYGERRDRSILFWKSLPVSDITTALAKAAIPLAVLPLITFAVTVVMQFIMVLISTVVLTGSGLSAASLWSRTFEIWVMLFYHLVLIHGLWYAPLYGWLLLVSAWARRAPFLWAFLPPLTIVVIEKIVFNTSYFIHLIGYRSTGEMASGGLTAKTVAIDLLPMGSPGQFLLSPGFWLGLAITAVFLAAAVRLRRRRGPF